MIDRNMKRMELLEAVEMSPNTLAKFGRNEDVFMDVLCRICGYFECDSGDIMEMVSTDTREWHEYIAVTRVVRYGC